MPKNDGPKQIRRQRCNDNFSKKLTQTKISHYSIIIYLHSKQKQIKKKINNLQLYTKILKISQKIIHTHNLSYKHTTFFCCLKRNLLHKTFTTKKNRF